MSTHADLEQPEWSFVFADDAPLIALDDAPAHPFTAQDVVAVEHLVSGGGPSELPWLALARLDDGRWVYASHRSPTIGEASCVRYVARRLVLLWWGALGDDDRARLDGRGTVTRAEREEELVVLDERLQSRDVAVRRDGQARTEELARRAHAGGFSLYDVQRRQFVRAGVEMAQLASCVRDMHDVVSETVAFTCRTWPALAPCRVRAHDAFVPGEARLASWQARPNEAQVQALREHLRAGGVVRVVLFNRRARSVAEWVLVPADE